jgi:glutamate dehydrogenase
MAWLADHARSRGASWWKASSTGKPASTHGGIPHDVYGMTSLSVRAYTTGIYRKCVSIFLFSFLFHAFLSSRTILTRTPRHRLGLKEEEVTKVQTGGPDGDLGSNEILLSKDKTIASASFSFFSSAPYSPLSIYSHRRFRYDPRP